MDNNQQLAIRDDMPLMDLGNILAKSGFFQDTRDAAQAIVKVLAGRELGFGPIASMTGVNIVKGRPALSANLMAAAIKRSGRYTYRVVRLDDQACEIAFFENGQEIGRSVFTREDAKKAGTQNMDKYPRNMLFARALSNGAKWYCPDIFGGPVYTPEELGAPVNEDGEIIDVTPVAPAPADDRLAEIDEIPGVAVVEQAPKQAQTDAKARPPKNKRNGNGSEPQPMTVQDAVEYRTPKGSRLGDLGPGELQVVVERGKGELVQAAKLLLAKPREQAWQAWDELGTRAEAVGLAPLKLEQGTTNLELYQHYNELLTLVEEAEQAMAGM